MIKCARCGNGVALYELPETEHHTVDHGAMCRDCRSKVKGAPSTLPSDPGTKADLTGQRRRERAIRMVGERVVAKAAQDRATGGSWPRRGIPVCARCRLPMPRSGWMTPGGAVLQTHGQWREPHNWTHRVLLNFTIEGDSPCVVCTEAAQLKVRGRVVEARPGERADFHEPAKPEPTIAKAERRLAFCSRCANYLIERKSVRFKKTGLGLRLLDDTRGMPTAESRCMACVRNADITLRASFD